jgi:outer membrane protein assembly factor BamD (BamD/ComL family)
MKNRSRFVPALILLLFTAAGCSPDQYSVEREYWRARRLKDAIITNLGNVSQAQFEKAVRQLDNFIGMYPGNKLTTEAELDIAALQVAMKNHEKARQQLSMMLEKYADSQGICADVRFLIGNSYQIEGNWDAALAEYKRITLDYPTTIRGLEMPLYIAQYHKQRKQEDESKTAYREAIRHYTQLNSQYPNSELGLYALRNAGRCYMELEEWKSALEVFNGIARDYRGKAAIDDVLMNIAVIYAHKFKDKKKAAAALQQLVEDHPDSKFVRAAEFMLEEWSKK